MENENIEPPIKHRKIRRPKKIGAKKFSAKCHNCSGLGHNKRTCTLQQPTAKGKGSIGGVSQRKSTQTTKQPSTFEHGSSSSIKSHGRGRSLNNPQ
ncbi:hypothetical protein ACOSQ4_004599 [Xanthoceras sorbifolium]